LSERNTVQKQIILDTLKSFNTHPSVDEIYSVIQKSHPSISKATIYRNMSQLAEKGVILQIAVANDVSRYDGCTDFHHHFICEGCGGVFDVYQDQNTEVNHENLYGFIRDKYGYEVNRSMTSFFGNCAECK
jgi:Fe2+ or Zn2+ uptake regulation protein